jgi:hypothetical protein
LRLFIITVMVTMAACQGSWAQQTSVTLKSLGKSGVTGLAIVSIGKGCDDQGNCHIEGSNIWPQLTASASMSIYRVILAKGSCTTPPSSGTELDKASGETLKTAGGSAHVDIPISLLTRGDYVLVVQNASHTVVACGVIKRSGFA